MGSSASVETLLVTGATGFVGSHVAELAPNFGFQLRALVRKPADMARLQAVGFECVQGSLEDAGALRRAMAGTTAVLHLAAATKARTPEEYQRANVAGTQAVVEAMLSAEPKPQRLIYLSSLAAVGPPVQGRPVSRDDPPRPLTTYGRTKLAGEKVCEVAADRLQVAILRAPAVYGPRDRDVFQFFRMANRGVVPLPSTATGQLQMIHARDLARSLLLAATSSAAHGVYHVAESRAYGWEEMARMVGAALGKQVRVVRMPAAVIKVAAGIVETIAGLVGKSTIFNREKASELTVSGWLCETELARRDFGFEAHTPLQAGFNETANWYRQHGWL
ncbi:MAG TPA: NAD-dependent epimerase/dehydratase family protein [Longimicrobiales bacterium]|nr:NAD-dependent epimerase/dehydratase family protein [Longimicrobiales bacterium]